jgi:tRNA (adenine37-N6)-methyltransferase
VAASFYWTDEDLLELEEIDRTPALPAMRPIGRVERESSPGPAGPHHERGEARIVLDPSLAEGLAGLESGQRMMVVFAFHRAGTFELLQHPRGDAGRPKRGVFSLRSPRRPNPIGVTVVDIVEVAGNVVLVRGMDAFDGTPVLDLKPALTKEAW